ncbi:hypothetical protein [Paenacidovorax caeni]|uniref:hypothetical protein n=1 Tax=Paenacidovorax caeni TaxID=343013 RepID=UPI0011140916|nr:hypothetical protein [Paenacidovorax caeni]
MNDKAHCGTAMFLCDLVIGPFSSKADHPSAGFHQASFQDLYPIDVYLLTHCTYGNAFQSGILSLEGQLPMASLLFAFGLSQ